MSSPLGPAVSSGFSQMLGTGTRGVYPIISINGTDVSQQLYSQLKKVTYRQTYANTFDSLTIQFVDPAELFVNTFKISPGIQVSFSIKTINWRFPGDSQIVSMGSFVVDEVQASFPPDLFTMKCICATALGYAKYSNLTRTWGGTLLSIGQQIAKEAGVTLQGNPASVLTDLGNVPVAGSDGNQSNCSDLVFFAELCRRHYYATKYHDGVLWVFNEMSLDGQTPSFTIVKPTVGVIGGLGLGVLSANFTCSVQDNNYYAVNGARYQNIRTGQLISTDPGSGSTIDSSAAGVNEKLSYQPAGQPPPVITSLHPPIIPNNND
jgi:phage protein D